MTIPQILELEGQRMEIWVTLMHAVQDHFEGFQNGHRNDEIPKTFRTVRYFDQGISLAQLVRRVARWKAMANQSTILQRLQYPRWFE